jgi:predicted Zn-dependent peptidase
VGGRHESARLNGASHFVEHLVFKGTAKRSAREISEAIEGRGGYFDAYTQEELTCYYARVTPEFLPQVFDVLADMVTAPRFAPGDISREREVICEEIAMYRDQPAQHVEEMLMASIWPDHPLGRPLTGTEEALKRIGRRELVRFKEQHYRPAGMVIGFAGNVSHRESVRLARKQFGRLPAGPARPAPVAGADSAIVPFAVERRPIDQTHLSAGLHVFGRRDERRYALKLMSVILGENMSSRLFQVVREEHGLAYAISSGLHLFEDVGLFAVDAGLDVARTAQAARLIARELRRFRDEGPSKAVLQRAKDYTVGQLRLGLESTAAQAGWMAEQWLLFGRIGQPEETVARFAAITPDEVRAVAAAVLRAELLSVAVISPRPRREMESWGRILRDALA